ncbi:MAG TPA: hypothetical protein VMF11_01145 [Candidatus Baltobacteraceae bacterium]|nr:hypothetical protein [Candidatus Baltobacteraceae bacterium]
MIAALAGRRIDAPNAPEPHFPPANIAAVERAIRARLERDGVRVLVCAAACGADLLALAAAEELRIARHIVLPYAIERFRAGSVTDRRGAYPWGERYDRFIAQAQSQHALTLLGLDPNDPSVYEKTNFGILDTAAAIAAGMHEAAEAIVVWDEELRTGHDLTEHFANAAHARNMPVVSISILRP